MVMEDARKDATVWFFCRWRTEKKGGAKPPQGLDSQGRGHIWYESVTMFASPGQIPSMNLLEIVRSYPQSSPLRRRLECKACRDVTRHVERDGSGAQGHCRHHGGGAYRAVRGRC